MAWVGAAAGLVGALISSDSAATNAEAGAQAAQLQYQIAKRIQDRADYLFDLWKSDYLDCEKALAAEICALPAYVPQYDTVSVRAISAVRRQFGRAREKALACLDVHCLGAYCGLVRDLAIAEAGAAAWAAMAAIRTEDEKARLISQQRREEKYRMVAFAHGAYFDTKAAELASKIYDQVGAAARAAAASDSKAAGYFLERAIQQFGGKNTGTQSAAPIRQSQGQTPDSMSANQGVNGNQDVAMDDGYNTGQNPYDGGVSSSDSDTLSVDPGGSFNPDN